MAGKFAWPDSVKRSLLHAVLDEGMSQPRAIDAAKRKLLAGYPYEHPVPPISTLRAWIHVEKIARAEQRAKDELVPLADVCDSQARRVLALAEKELYRLETMRGKPDLKRLNEVLALVAAASKITTGKPLTGKARAAEPQEAEEPQLPNGHGAARLAETVAAMARAAQDNTNDTETTDTPEPTPPAPEAQPSDKDQQRASGGHLLHAAQLAAARARAGVEVGP